MTSPPSRNSDSSFVDLEQYCSSRSCTPISLPSAPSIYYSTPTILNIPPLIRSRTLGDVPHTHPLYNSPISLSPSDIVVNVEPDHEIVNASLHEYKQKEEFKEPEQVDLELANSIQSPRNTLSPYIPVTRPIMRAQPVQPVQPVQSRNIKKILSCNLIGSLVIFIIFVILTFQLDEYVKDQRKIENKYTTIVEKIVTRTVLNCSEYYEFGYTHESHKISTKILAFQCPINQCSCEVLASQWITNQEKETFYYNIQNPLDYIGYREYKNLHSDMSSNIICLAILDTFICLIMLVLILSSIRNIIILNKAR